FQMRCLILLLYLFQPSLPYPNKIPIKSFTISIENGHLVEKAVKYSRDEMNRRESPPFRLSLDHIEIKKEPTEAYDMITTVCQELKEGAMGIISLKDGRGYDSLKGLSENLEIPLISLNPPSFPPEYPSRLEVSLWPSPAEVVADFIIHKGWSDLIMMSDTHNSGISFPYLWSKVRERSNETIVGQVIQLPLEEEKFDDFLRKFNLMRGDKINRILIDTTSTSRLQKLLSTIRAAQFNQGNYHYVIVNFEFLPYDVAMFENGNINISGFQIIDREHKQYWDLKKHLEEKKDESEISLDHYTDITARVALAHDTVIAAFHGFLRALSQNDSIFSKSFRHGKLYNRGYRGIYCDPSTDRENPARPYSSFEHGDMIGAALHGIDIDSRDGTLTGRIQFDRFGHRINYHVNVIDLVSNMRSVYNRKEALSWVQGKGFILNQTISDHTRKNHEDLNNRIVKVGTNFVSPFVMSKRECIDGNNRTECLGNSRFEGYCIDLLNLLQDKIDGFNYEIVMRDKAGSKRPDGSWDGLVGDLLNGDIDVALASLTINQDRERVVDFSKPFMTTGISIMIKKPDKQEFSVFSFMQPLSTEIWMYIIFAYVGVSVVIFLVSRFSPYEWRVEETIRGGFTISNDFSVYNCLWFTLAAFMQQGTDILPRSISGRIASSAWWFFTMIIVSSYTANLAAFLTLEKMQAPIESVEDLAKQTKIKYGIQQGGSTAQFFRHSSVQIYQRMWRYMESQVPSVFVSSYAEGIDRVRNQKGRYAFLLEATANEYENTRRPCDTMKVGANLNSIGYGVATPFGSDLKDPINLAILALQERGELKKLENKWWYDRGQCDQGMNQDGSSASLNLSKVAGIFYILMGGMIASMIAALGEFLYRSRIEARKADPQLCGNFARNLKTALSSQLQLSMKGGATAHPGTNSHEALKRQKAASFLPASSEGVDGKTQPFPFNTAV
ncbi:glr-1, partial [Pristionchus pacificus]